MQQHQRLFGKLAAGIGILMFAVCSVQMHAQPVLNFKRVVNNWPTIELYYGLACNGKPDWTIDKSKFRVFENDAAVDSFTLFCPDPAVDRPISTALVFDASGSMAGSGNAGAKSAGLAFVDMMDGATDEAAVIWFNSIVTVAQPMTVYKDLLQNAINGLPASGGTAVWDGIYFGLLNLINDGVNPCRAVIALTDGGDNSSSRQPYEIISLANRNSIRVFTIGVGSGVQAAILQNIADLTGGRYYETPTPGNLTQIYQEIFPLLKACGWECVITYKAKCMDGGLRKVDLSVVDHCNGSDTKTKTYKALKDTSTYSDLHIRLENETASDVSEVVVPLLLEDAIAMDFLYGASFQVLYDPSLLQFVRTEAPFGSLLYGVPVSTTPLAPGSVALQTMDKMFISASTPPALLLNLVFTTRDIGARDTVDTPLHLTGWTFAAGCFRPRLADGTVKLIRGWKDGARASIDSVRLVGNRVRVYFRGKCSKTNVVDVPDSNIVLTRDGTPARNMTIQRGPDSTAQLTAEFDQICKDGLTHTVLLMWRHLCDSTVLLGGSYTAPSEFRSLFSTGKMHLCAGDSVVLRGDTGLVSYTWSTGERTPSITVKSGGMYRLTARNSDSCEFIYLPAYVTASPPAPNIFPAGPIQLCKGDQVTLSVPQGYSSYLWSNGIRTRLNVVTQAGSYLVTLTDSLGCTVSTAPVTVLVRDTLNPEITIVGPQKPCEGDQVMLMTEPGLSRYLWSTGDTTSVISVSRSGTYFVSAWTNSGCFGTSTGKTISFAPVPQPRINQPDSTIVCANDSLVLDAGIDSVEYTWSNGATTRSILVRTSGSYYVRARNSHGCVGTSNTVVVTLRPSPPTPTVTRFGDVLTTQSADSYQWFRGDTLLGGETNQFIACKLPGNYRVRITNAYGCVSWSATFFVGVLSIDEASSLHDFSVDVYPNPANGTTIVTVRSAVVARARILLLDLLGRVLREESLETSGGAASRNIELGGIPAGLYILEVRAAETTITKPLLVR